MKRIRFKQFWIVSCISAVLSFVLLYGGIKGILDKSVAFQNLLSYGVLSILLGIIAGAFYAIRVRITFWLYIAGILVGFFTMFSQYLVNRNGWGDIAGLFYLLVWSGIGLASGLLVQLIWYLIIHSQNRNK